MDVLAISGSLRGTSTNTTLLRAAALLAPPGMTVTLYSGLGDLPPFNPDLDSEPGPDMVGDFRARLRTSDGVLISTPEYAHGLPGVLKNALDWVVGSGELVGKPIALLNASPRATFAQSNLTETLTVMSARLLPDASSTVSLGGRNLDADGIAATPEFAAPLRAALAAFADAIQELPL